MGIGDGETNTVGIVSKLGPGSYAARICYDLVLGGFATTSFYWSSSESDSIDAWMYLFQFDEARQEMKSFGGRVRAARYF